MATAPKKSTKSKAKVVEAPVPVVVETPKANYGVVLAIIITITIAAIAIGASVFWSTTVGKYLFITTVEHQIQQQVQNRVDAVKEQVKNIVVMPPITQIAPPKPDKPTYKVLMNEPARYYLRLQRDDGTIELRTGGSPEWRMNNPGSLEFGQLAKNHGALEATPVTNAAVFPTYDAGRKAFLANLELQNKTLKTIVATYNPKKSDTFASKLAKQLGVSVSTSFRDLSTDQKEKFLDLIKTASYWVDGKVRVFATASEFEKKGW